MKTELKPITLSVPGTENKATLAEALKNRHTTREFDIRPLDEKLLSDLLWSAYGVNRPDGGLTAPAAWGLHSLEIYVVTADGIYLYDAAKHELQPKVAGDRRQVAGVQEFVATAPLSIVIYSNFKKLVLDDERMNTALQQSRHRVSDLDAGAVCQNIYLYCAANGLNAVERMMVDEERFSTLLDLDEDHHFIIAMTAGYPPSE